MNDKLVKQDINFLEHPLWFQDSKLAETSNEGFIWQDQAGFIYRAGYKPPVQIDMIFLLYLLLRSQKDDWNEVIEISRFEILKDCQVGTSTYWYDRLEDCLERWKMVGVKFQGAFYDGTSYQTINFGIIDSWRINEENKKLLVRFSSEWLLYVQHSNFFKLINFEEIKVLHSPLATRLYEILIKSFQGRTKWEIDAIKMAQKIPMNEHYPADVIPKVKAAVNRINEYTELQIKLEVRRPQRGKAILVFYKLSKEQSEPETTEGPKLLDVLEGQEEDLKKLLELVPEEHRFKKTVLEMVSKALRKQDEGYVRRNILYANTNATRNYRAYLSKALKEDWAADQQAPSTPAPKEAPKHQGEEISQERPITLQDLGIPPEKQWNIEELLKMVPQKECENEWIQHLISNELDEKGYEYVLWNILYSNKYALGSYYTMLKTALESNAGGLNRKMVLNKPLSSSPKS